MNETLEAMARTIFKSWFVDFDPVRARLRDASQQSWIQRPRNCFPTSLEYPISVKYHSGGRYDRSAKLFEFWVGEHRDTRETFYWEGGTHFFCTPKDMSSLTSPVLLNTERYLTDKGLAKVSSGQLPVGTVLMSSRAPIGYLAISEIPVSINQGIIAMVWDKQLPNLYVLFWAQENEDIHCDS